ncbi:MAG: hypothetical protein JNL11_10835 [Bdellovibrionaceae bacterium]|nr:hypothetical protein [Pseudobdellovibrionaceae bacterium]
MQEFLDKALPILNSILQILGGIVIAATVIAKMTSKTDADDKLVAGFAEKLFKVIAWLPTIGINPQTKKIQDAYEELKAKNDSDKAA